MAGLIISYYQGILNDYVKENNLPFKIKVTGVDTGKYTDSFLLDTTRGADIFVTAHDNLGKLLAGSGTIAPVTDEDLVANIEDTIDPIFQDVIYMSAAGGQSESASAPCGCRPAGGSVLPEKSGHHHGLCPGTGKPAG